MKRTLNFCHGRVGLIAAVLLFFTFMTNSTCRGNDANQNLQWKKITPLPDREGFAGPFAGVHNGALIVAGGANFPGKRPWEGGEKIWYDSVFVLEKPDGEWKTGFKLPRPLGYGASISHSSGVICIGGSDNKQHHENIFTLSCVNGKIQIARLPDLPKPCANLCGALVNEMIYIAGGLEKPDSTNALKTFFALDLKKPDAGWKELEPWPGPERMLAVAGVANGKFFLFGGASLKKGADGKVVREWLRDAYCFTSSQGWKRLADLPRPAVAAPSPASFVGNKLLILGGDDGAQINTPPTEHHGFPRDVLAYDVKTDSWEKLSEMPFGLVTTPSVNWNKQIIVPGGEARPGIRSTEVWAGSLIRSR